MTDATPFTLSIRVPDADIDPLRHVNNVAFLRYVQEAAVAHWRSVAPADLAATYTWVVRRHEIDYLRPGLPGDELVATTWVGVPTAATWERFTEITRPADGQLLAKARTVWVLLDAATGRPRRVEGLLSGGRFPGFGAIQKDRPGPVREGGLNPGEPGA